MSAPSEGPKTTRSRSAFEAATSITAGDGEGLFRAHVPDRWQQGRGAFGGLAVGILTRAIVASETDTKRRLRSLSADLCAPAMPGDASVRVTTLRRGTGMTYLDAQLRQGEQLIARASAVLAAARDVVHPTFQPPSPARPPWKEVPALPVEPPIGPVFADKYEYRSTGPLPFAGGVEPVTAGWLREKTGHVFDEAAIVGLLDAWWPATFSVEPAPRGVATVGYTMQLLVDPHTLEPAVPLYYRGRGVAAAENFFVEMRELWAGDRVVAMNQQTFALLT